MRIVYCTPSIYIAGGVERVLTTKANYFADVLGYEIYIVLTDGKDKPPYYPLSEKIKVIHLDINFEELWHLSFWKKIPVYLQKQRVFKKRLEEVLMQIKPDITVSLLRREINFITAIKDGSKKIGEIHINKEHYRNFEKGNVTFIQKWFSYIWQLQLVKKLKKLDKFIVLTEDDKKSWHELDNVIVIPNPLTHFPEATSSVENKEAISVGRFSHEKGYNELISCWEIVHRKHPDWKLNIFGTGVVENLTPLIQEKGLHETICPQLPTNDIYKEYLSNSIYICSSHFEGFGMTLTEAMSCGVPCVSFDCPHGPRNIITDAVDGFLTTPQDIEKLAEKICYLIENPEKRKELGRNAARNIKRLNMENIGQKWNALFNDLTQEKNNHA